MGMLLIALSGCGQTQETKPEIEHSIVVIELRLAQAKLELEMAQENKRYEAAILNDVESREGDKREAWFHQYHRCTQADLAAAKAEIKVLELKKILKIVREGTKGK